MRGHKLFIILAVVLSLALFQLNSVKAASINASFTVLNGTIGLNQNLFFQVSADFPQNISYVIYMDNVSVMSGQIIGNFPGYKIVHYNVTNTEFGSYKPSIKFSAISTQIQSNMTTDILAKPSFGFVGYSNYTSFFNNSAKMLIDIKNNGNTPLNFTWTLPTVQGVAFSLEYKQLFTLLPSQTFNIPINLTLSNTFTSALNFSFYAAFQNYSLLRSYVTDLFSPVVNISFQNGSLITGTNNSSIYTIKITNGNNLPINTTFSFLLDIGGNEFYYNKSLIISPSTSEINLTIPKSTVLNLAAYYLSQNGTPIKQQIFSQPASTSLIQPEMLMDSFYIVILILAVLALVWLHIRFNRKK